MWLGEITHCNVNISRKGGAPMDPNPQEPGLFIWGNHGNPALESIIVEACDLTRSLRMCLMSARPSPLISMDLGVVFASCSHVSLWERGHENQPCCEVCSHMFKKPRYISSKQWKWWIRPPCIEGPVIWTKGGTTGVGSPGWMPPFPLYSIWPPVLWSVWAQPVVVWWG